MWQKKTHKIEIFHQEKKTTIVTLSLDARAVIKYVAHSHIILALPFFICNK